jgi:hypothetical protein
LRQLLPDHAVNATGGNEGAQPTYCTDAEGGRIKSSEEKAKAVIESWREARENLLRLKKSLQGCDDVDVKQRRGLRSLSRVERPATPPSGVKRGYDHLKAFKSTFFIVQCINLMEDLKLLLIDRLKSKGMDPALIPAFLKALTSLIAAESGIDPARINQKLLSLGWDEVAIDYHCLQIAIACLEAETK